MLVLNYFILAVAQLFHFTKQLYQLSMAILDNLKYSEDHEWVRVEEGNIVYVGITDHAQGELGEIVYVEVESVGEALNAGDVFGTVEAVKTTSDLLMPIGGKILAFNPALDENEGDDPTLINSSPYKDGWIIKIEMADSGELNNLLDAEAYGDLIS